MPALFHCPELDCWQALFDDAVEPSQRQAFEHHLETCRACQERIHQAEDNRDGLLTTVRQLASSPTEPHAPDLDGFLERLRGVKSALHPQQTADLTFLRPADRPALLGLLGPYEVLEVIGQGGMGIVLKAFEPALKRLVAVKVLAPCLASSVNARRRFTREARSAAAVSHDYVVQVHSVLEEAGLPYLVMEYIAGESLQSRLDRTGTLEVAEIVRIGLQTALGLAAAHAQGLIHRDVKPANILLEIGAERVKITDFGLARMVDDVHLTQNGVVAGTPEYMAPEQARGEPIDHRTDLFSLGSVLYALCTGSPPFRGSSALAVLQQVSETEPVAIRSLNPAVPQWLEALIARLMAKAPADRFQSAAEVASMLEESLEQMRQPATYGIWKHPWLAVGLLLLAALVLVPASLWFRGSLFPAAMQEAPPAPPGRAAAEGKKEGPPAEVKQVQVPVQAAVAPPNLGPTPAQQRAIAILRRINAKFKFDAPGQPVVHVSIEPGTEVDAILEELLPLTQIGVLGLQGTKLTDAGLKHVAGFKKMHQLYLGRTAVTDAGLKELANLERLTHLGLEDTQISDAGLKSLVNLRDLNYLNVGRTAVSDACLPDIAGFSNLGMLCLYSTHVTDAGMKQLKGLTNLRTLMLNDTAVTDAGIKELELLKQLNKIEVQHTRITDAGVKALQQALPAAKIEIDPDAVLRGQGRVRGWLVAAVLLAGVIALTAAGLVLAVRKRSRGSMAPPEREPLTKNTSSPAIPLAILLQCPSCQRKLQARMELAGKAVKCPSCGSAVEVPSVRAGLPGGPAA
jgi:hypothetical protein